MRKVTQITAGAFVARTNACCGNTSTDGETLQLHGNTIAKWSFGILHLSNAQWSSVTTKERLNGILDCAGSKLRVFQKNFEWFIQPYDNSAEPISFPEDGSWYSVGEIV